MQSQICLSNPCPCLCKRPSSLFLASFPRCDLIRAQKQTRICFRLIQSFHGIEFASNKEWRLFCSSQQRTSFGIGNSDSNENNKSVESEIPESDRPIADNNWWIQGLRKGLHAIPRTLYGEPWMVPWTAETILQVMLLWIVSFWFVGSWIIPFLAYVTGFSKETLTCRGQALYSLLTDVAEGLAGIVILHRCLARFRPLPTNWFRFSLRGNWPLDVGLGCLVFPLVNQLSQVNLNLLPLLPSPMNASSVEQSIVTRDPVAMALYAVVVSVCAPLWEEIVFRGFLLPSLTKYMPVWCSVLVSAVAFAVVHFNVQRLLPLVLLGVVMGVVFTRSRNLLSSMLLHSLWNAFVFLDLMK